MKPRIPYENLRGGYFYDIIEGINELESQENKELSINLRDTKTNINPTEIVANCVFSYNVTTKFMQGRILNLNLLQNINKQMID